MPDTAFISRGPMHLWTGRPCVGFRECDSKTSAAVGERMRHTISYPNPHHNRVISRKRGLESVSAGPGSRQGTGKLGWDSVSAGPCRCPVKVGWLKFFKVQRDLHALYHSLLVFSLRSGKMQEDKAPDLETHKSSSEGALLELGRE